MTSLPAFDEPLEIGLEDGEVVITGPDGLCASLTLAAARETVRRLSNVLAGLPEGASESDPKPLG